ncbi:PHB depolymerase family esterase [Pseudonocardia ailaonensis]|uniref:PHB depolymerase family esterase n=1 Tax=Pseudonocardia ailaonensis TaxID=367279 RepID=A0ABN2NAT8_9PSEU
MRRLLPLLLLAPLLAAACSAPAAGPSPAPSAPPGSATAAVVPASPGDRTLSLTRPEGAREAIVVHPASARPGAALVVVMHGSGGTGEDMRGLGFDDLAARDGVIMAYPQGLSGTWNAGACCGSAASKKIDDVGYLTALAATLVGTDGVDPRRVYAVGFSNGAMMSYTWACAGGALAGIGPVAGATTGPCPSPTPTSVIALAGTADDRVKIEGRPERGWDSLEVTLAPFLTADACAAPATSTDGPATLTTWACGGGHTVVRDVLAGQGHSWPDSATGFLWEKLGI